MKVLTLTRPEGGWNRATPDNPLIREAMFALLRDGADEEAVVVVPQAEWDEMLDSEELRKMMLAAPASKEPTSFFGTAIHVGHVTPFFRRIFDLRLECRRAIRRALALSDELARAMGYGPDEVRDAAALQLDWIFGSHVVTATTLADAGFLLAPDPGRAILSIVNDPDPSDHVKDDVLHQIWRASDL